MTTDETFHEVKFSENNAQMPENRAFSRKINRLAKWPWSAYYIDSDINKC